MTKQPTQAQQCNHTLVELGRERGGLAFLSQKFIRADNHQELVTYGCDRCGKVEAFSVVDIEEAGD